MDKQQPTEEDERMLRRLDFYKVDVPGFTYECQSYKIQIRFCPRYLWQLQLHYVEGTASFWAGHRLENSSLADCLAAGFIETGRKQERDRIRKVLG